MKNNSKWQRSKKKLMAAGAALGIAFADFDPATPPPKHEIVFQMDEKSGDDNKNKKGSNKSCT